ncbi:MAG: hypothetical protein JO128_19475, partial [Alphaproteobacteria bacterium]|nr:hypothetical protein [Alphaproteobacteria bacterium]
MRAECPRIAAVLAALLLAMLCAAPALAQTPVPAAAPSPAQISPQDAENLLKTLQDPDARQKFTEQL